MVKTIKVSDETHKALTTIPGELTSSSGRILTYDQVIKHLVDMWFKIGRKTMSKRAIPTDNVATKGEGRVGPFIAGLLSAAVRNAETAERILKEKGDKLTLEERAYYEHVIREGKTAKRFLEEHGIRVIAPLLDSYQLDENSDQNNATK
ncbi:MAG: hypothetical protein QXM54_03965 [Desulfurococcaceae archaeon]